MSNFSQFFPAGSGGSGGSGINSYAPFKVGTADNNPQGYIASTGLYTNPIDSSVWLKTGTVAADTTPRTYPNAYFEEDMYIGLQAGIKLSPDNPFSSAGNIHYQRSTGRIYNQNSGNLSSWTINASTGAYENKVNFTPYAGPATYQSWSGGFTFHEGSQTWYSRGVFNNPTMTLISMGTVAGGGPDVANPVQQNITALTNNNPSGYMVIGNFLYVFKDNRYIYKYSINPSTGVITDTNVSFDIISLVPTLSATTSGQFADLMYDTISGYAYVVAQPGYNPTLLGMIQLDPTTFTATGVVYPIDTNLSNNGYDPFQFGTFGLVGTKNVIFTQSTNNATRLVNQFYSQATDFIQKVGDPIARTSAMGDGQPLFIKLK
ncbi:hypothetical protein N9F16_00800 [bacterium]|nr:hypothetical protein [bacterium]